MTKGEVARKTMITVIFNLCSGGHRHVVKHPTDAIRPGTCYGTKEGDGFQKERGIQPNTYLPYINI